MTEIQIGHWAKFGAAIRDARRARTMSQAELAEQAGVSRSWLAKVEAGHRGAEFEQILLVLAALELTLTLRDERQAAWADTDDPAPVNPQVPAAAASLAAERHRAAAGSRRASWRAASLARAEVET